MNDNSEIMLTIWCTTYNFAPYVRDTFEGFIKQRTSFKYKIFVFDDASTDGTDQIIREYIEKYPHLFSAYISKENTYNSPDRNELLDSLFYNHQKGKYIAQCEGDDYWNDPEKLQKQVDYLESHPECSMVVHSANWIDEIKGTEYVLPRLGSDHYLTSDEAITQASGRIQTASYVFRTCDYIPDPGFPDSHPWEYARILYEFARGKVYYFDKPMSTYRYRHVGSWTEQYSKNLRFTAETQWHLQALLEKYDKYTKNSYSQSINARLASNVMDALLLCPDVDFDEYEEEIKKNNILSEENKIRFKEARKQIGSIVRGNYSFNDKERRILDRSNHIYIYGCGEYSKYMRECVKNNGLKLDGYLVSDDQEMSETEDIYKLKDFPYKFEDTAVIIGVSQKFEIQIRQELDKYNIKNVIDSFWIRDLLFCK